MARGIRGHVVGPVRKALFPGRGHQRIVVAGYHKNGFRGAEFLEACACALEFGGQRQLGQIAGYGDQVGLDLPHRTDEGGEHLGAVFPAAVQAPAHAT